MYHMKWIIFFFFSTWWRWRKASLMMLSKELEKFNGVFDTYDRKTFFTHIPSKIYLSGIHSLDTLPFLFFSELQSIISYNFNASRKSVTSYLHETLYSIAKIFARFHTLSRWMTFWGIFANGNLATVYMCYY